MSGKASNLFSSLEEQVAWLRERRSDLGITQADAAQRLDVTERTYRRWENGAPITKDKDRRALIRLFGVPGKMAAGDDELSHIVNQMRRIAGRYRVRRDQHASADELRRLRAELELNVRNGLQAGTSDPTALDALVDAVVGLATLDNEPPDEPRTHAGQGAARTNAAS